MSCRLRKSYTGRPKHSRGECEAPHTSADRCTLSICSVFRSSVRCWHIIVVNCYSRKTAFQRSEDTLAAFPLLWNHDIIHTTGMVDSHKYWHSPATDNAEEVLCVIVLSTSDDSSSGARVHKVSLTYGMHHTTHQQSTQVFETYQNPVCRNLGVIGSHTRRCVCVLQTHTHSPPLMVEPLARAVLNCPPATVPASSAALLLCPPLMVALYPTAMFEAPPATTAYSPPAVL